MSKQSERVYRTNLMRLENLSTAMLFVCTAILFSLAPAKPEELDNSLKWVLCAVALALPASALGFMIKLEREYFGKPILNKDDTLLIRFNIKEYIYKLLNKSVSYSRLHFFQSLSSSKEYVIKFIKWIIGLNPLNIFSSDITLDLIYSVELAISFCIIIGYFGLIPLFYHFSDTHGRFFLFSSSISVSFYIYLSYKVDKELAKESEPLQQNNFEDSMQ